MQQRLNHDSKLKNAIIIQHVSFEDLGHIRPQLDRYGYRVTTYHPPGDEVWTIDLMYTDLLIVLGGPMSANDRIKEGHVADEVRLVQTALQRGVPILGICLGAQILAVAAGGQIAPMPSKEIGLAPLRLTPEGANSALVHMPTGLPVLHWHGEAVVELPPGAKRLAETNLCDVQAFSLSDRTLGLQFHLETELRRLPEWVAGHAVEVAHAQIDGAALVDRGALFADGVALACEKVIGAWLASLPR